MEDFDPFDLLLDDGDDEEYRLEIEAIYDDLVEADSCMDNVHRLIEAAYDNGLLRGGKDEQ